MIIPAALRTRFGNLLPAEARVLARMAEDEEVVIGGDLPTEGDATRKIRAEFVAVLAHGGCEGAAPPPSGLHIRGAWIAGELDLRGPQIDLDLGLYDCRFDAPPLLRSARLANLYLNRSRLPGIVADGLETRGDVFLRGAVVQGEARFPGARLGGTLDCDGARFEREGGKALFLQGAEVAGAFFLREGASVRGELDLSGARIEHINDDRACWPGPGDLLLDRCRYGAFIGGPVDARSRLDWLALQDEAQFGQDFWPQPYEQLAKVFREMGHAADARAVLIRKEKLQRRARRARMTPPGRALYALRDGLLAVTLRYGRAPMLAGAWLLALAVIGFALFDVAAQHGAIKPNTGYTLRAPEWVACGAAMGETVHDPATGETLKGRREAEHGTRLDCFLAQPEGRNYPRFDAAIYSLDTLLPIVDLEMQDFWIPDETADWPYAEATRWYLWLHIGLGWGLSLLAVAGFSGLVKSD